MQHGLFYFVNTKRDSNRLSVPANNSAVRSWAWGVMPWMA